MSRLVVLLVTVFAAFSAVHVHSKQFVRLCYFPNWANTRESEYTRYDVQDIPPTLCTHLVYAFAKLDRTSLTIVPTYSGEDSTAGQPGRYEQFNDLKDSNSQLKTLISIGGEYAGSDLFVAITRNNSTLQSFAQSTVQFLRTRGFDGIDIDWEYPNATTKVYYTSLLEALRTAFDADTSGEERLLLTVALPAGSHRIAHFNMSAINRYVDLASLMTYDYHGGWNSITGFDSPLFSRDSDSNFNGELSTAWTVNHYLEQGLSADKILVGVTAAGTRFILQNASNYGVGAPVVKQDPPLLSPLWQLPSRYAFPEICRILQDSNANSVFDDEQKVPYTYNGTDWTGYDNVDSIRIKVQWMVQQGVAGAMFWALDMDDFTGALCNQGQYPLLTTLAQLTTNISTTPAATTTTPGGGGGEGNGDITTEGSTGTGGKLMGGGILVWLSWWLMWAFVVVFWYG